MPTLLPNAKQTFTGPNGTPLSSGSVYFYVPNTSTPKATYQDPGQTVLNPNPVPLDANGQAIIWGSGTYRQVVYDVNNNLIWDQITTDSSGGILGNYTDNIYVSGTGFTPGVTTQLNLSSGPGSSANVWVHFDAAFQSPDTWSLSGTTITFSSAIPIGVQEVVIKVGASISIGSPGSGTVFDSTVAAGAGIQSSKLSYTSPSSGATVRTVLSKLSDWLSVKDFGAVGDGTTDDTVALNNAFSGAYASGKCLFFPKGNYMIREFSSGIGYAILNPGVSFFGEGGVNSVIMPLPTMPNSANFMLIQPSGGAFLDFLFVRDIMFQPKNGSTKYGATCMYWNFQSASNSSSVNIEGVYCAPGNAYSMIWNNNGAINAQGVPAELVVERCAFWEGTQFVGGGDSNRFRDNVFRSSAASSRVGVQFNSVGTAGNAPSMLSIEDCNFDCNGGAVTVFGSYQTSIRHNNIEISAGAGSGSGAVVDIDGTTVPNSFASIRDNLISIFGTSTATSAIRVNACEGAMIDGNRLLSGLTPNQGILITGNATDTYVGLNEISASYANPVLDMGIGTRGVRKALTLQNGFSNGGGGFGTANVIKGKDGVVFLEGSISNAGAASGTVITTLPTGFIPLVGFTFIVYGNSGGTLIPTQVNVLSNGNVQMFASGSITSMSLNGISFNITSYIVSSN